MASHGVDGEHEAADRPGGAAGELALGQQRHRRLPERLAALAGSIAHLFQGLLADAARRHVHHPLEGRVVVAEAGEVEVGEHVLDLGALEEAQAAVDAVGQLLVDQRLFQHPRLGVGAVEDRGVGQRLAGLAPGVDALGDEARLVLLVEGGIDLDGLAVRAVGPQVLAQALLVVRDDRVGGLENGGGGTIVLLQPHHMGLREIALEMADVLHLRPAPAVDRLVVVAHREDVPGAARQQAQPAVLQFVGVLELVHQQMGEALAVMVEQGGVVAHRFQRTQQQLGEVDQPALAAELVIGVVQFQQLLAGGVVAGLDMARALAFFLAAIDVARHHARRPAGVVQPALAQQALDQTDLVVGVDDLEGLRQPGLLPVGAQQAVGDAVEGAEPHAGGAVTEQPLDPAAHLRRRLVGEGHGEDGIGRHAHRLHQPGDAVGEHAGLAGASASQHQGGGGWAGDGLTLGVVERVENGVQIHRRILAACRT